MNNSNDVSKIYVVKKLLDVSTSKLLLILFVFIQLSVLVDEFVSLDQSVFMLNQS